MGFLTNLISNKRADMGLSTLKYVMPWLEQMFIGKDTKAGISVNEEKAMSLTAVYSCVKLIAWTLASLPLPVYRNLLPKGKEKAYNNDIYKLLHDSPNSEQTSFEWRALTSAHQNLWGVGISEIEFDKKGYPVALWPIPPWSVTQKRTIDKQLVYEISVDGQRKILAPYQVLVFPALSLSQDKWLSPIGQHRESIGAAIAIKEFGAMTFGQGTNPAGILSGLKFPKDATEATIKEKFSEKYAGLGNSHRLMLLEDGIKFDRVGLPPSDAQYLESRKFDISEIARMYNVPLHLLQEVTGSTSWGSGLEELNLAFIAFTMRPYLVQWEQEFNKKLLFNSSRYFVEFTIEGLLRGKIADRYAAYAIGRQWGWLSANDIREIENMNPLDGEQGNIYLTPMNMVDAKEGNKRPQEVKKESSVVDPSAPQGGKDVKK